jgi:uncharacterized membrane protein
MTLWIISVILALLAVSAAPIIISYATKLFYRYGRRYPLLDNVGTIIVWALVGSFVIFLVGATAVFFHHLFLGI